MSDQHELSQLILTQPANQAALKVIQRGNTPASTSTGGAINLDNSLNEGAGLVLFSSHAAPIGRLLAVRSTNAAFSQTTAYFESGGTGHTMHVNQLQTNSATASAINITSANTGNSAVFLSGVETGRGTLKITHTGTGTDANASCISLDIAGSGTAAQGIFIDATGGGTTGDLMDLRNAGNQLFKFRGVSFTRPELQLGNGGPIITICTGTPEGQIAGPVGSIALRTDGGAGTSFYVKQAGTGNTGWVGK